VHLAGTLTKTKTNIMKVLNSIIAITFLSIAILSCKKSTEDTPAPAALATAGSFTWTENGGAVTTADSAFWTTCNGGTGIRAYKGAIIFIKKRKVKTFRFFNSLNIL
jgi:hypothetical protein